MGKCYHVRKKKTQPTEKSVLVLKGKKPQKQNGQNIFAKKTQRGGVRECYFFWHMEGRSKHCRVPRSAASKRGGRCALRVQERKMRLKCEMVIGQKKAEKDCLARANQINPPAPGQERGPLRK